MARAKVIFSTLDNVTNDVISSSFGRDAMGVMLSLDEATMATEPAFWTLFTSIFNAERIENEFGGVDPIRGIIMSGDKRQNWPFISSEMCNEFYQQLQLPFFCRLINSGFPHIQYSVQHRQHPAIFQLCRERSYQKEVHSAPNLDRLMTDREFNMLRKYLGGKQDLQLPARHPCGRTDLAARKAFLDFRMRVRLIHVTVSKSYILVNHSRVNYANAAATMDLLHALFLKTEDGKPFVPFRDMVIIAASSGQVELYEKEMLNFARTGGWNYEDMPEVFNGDAFQSRDARFVIFDMVIASTKTKSDLGFLSDEKRMTVLLTRAREFLFIVGRGDITLESQYQNLMDLATQEGRLRRRSKVEEICHHRTHCELPSPCVCFHGMIVN
jgi:AAA domain